jgi:5-methylcytosine-specific restriction enzyme subunit McrC
MSLESRTIRLREFGAADDVELSSSEVRFLNDSPAALSVLATGKSGCYRIAAEDRVGTLVGDTLKVVIEPKTPVPALLHMMGFGDAPSLADVAPFGDVENIARLLVSIFAETVDRALAGGGLVVAYRDEREELRSPRGRFDWLALETRRFGLFPPIPCEFTDLTLDTELNRRLLAAGQLLARVAGVRSATLERCLQRFVGVTSREYPRTKLAPVVLDRRTIRFRAALSLAEAVLRHAALDLSQGHTLATGFLLDMSEVFEDFVTASLASRLSAVGRLVASPSGLVLDRDGAISVTPDALIEDTFGAVPLVVDAKYKVTDAAKSNDVYQMVSYCTALAAPVGVLVYADASDSIHVILNTTCTILVYGIGLDRRVDDLERRMDQIAAEITRVAGGSHDSEALSAARA